MEKINFIKRKKAVRAKIFGTALKPRMAVYRSNKGLFVQLIDDEKGKTIIGLSSKNYTKDKSVKTKTDMAHLIGIKIAEIAKKKKITKIVFDKSGYKYHGRVKALADGAREGGLVF